MLGMGSFAWEPEADVNAYSRFWRHEMVQWDLGRSVIFRIIEGRGIMAFFDTAVSMRSCAHSSQAYISYIKESQNDGDFSNPTLFPTQSSSWDPNWDPNWENVPWVGVYIYLGSHFSDQEPIYVPTYLPTYLPTGLRNSFRPSIDTHHFPTWALLSSLIILWTTRMSPYILCSS